MTDKNAIPEVSGCGPKSIADRIPEDARPVVFRNLVDDWPMVAAGRRSADDAAQYLRGFYSGEPLTSFQGTPEYSGRIGYNEELTGFSFDRASATLDEVLTTVFDDSVSTRYVGSTLLDRWFPGFRDENDLQLENQDLLVSIWLGSRAKVSAHFDVADNIACCVAGRRRFTLFPPDQLDNLYVGPWDRTPAGQPISLVNVDDPDLEKYPNFRTALDAAFTVELEAGDALYIPSMWWHHVAGLDDFNVLVNYWWRNTPRYMGSPLSVFKHALLSLRGLPSEQRQAWRHIFDYYVFNSDEEKLSHLPPHSRGILGDLDDPTARQLRADLLNQLNR